MLGSRDSLMYRVSSSFTGKAKKALLTQSGDLGAQLEAHVRVFDIRLVSSSTGSLYGGRKRKQDRFTSFGPKWTTAWKKVVTFCKQQKERTAIFLKVKASSVNVQKKFRKWMKIQIGGSSWFNKQYR